MKNGPLRLVSDATWESSFGGLLWSPSRLADSPMADRIAEPVEFLNPSKSMVKKMPVLLLWYAISLAVVLMGMKFLQRPPLKGVFGNPVVLVTWITGFFYLLLLFHKRPATGLLRIRWGWSQGLHRVHSGASHPSVGIRGMADVSATTLLPDLCNSALHLSSSDITA